MENKQGIEVYTIQYYITIKRDFMKFDSILA